MMRIRASMGWHNNDHSLLVRDDGETVGFGKNETGQCDVPPRPVGTRYVAAAAGDYHSLLVRDDGQAVGFGDNEYGQCDVPPCPVGTCYVAAPAGYQHSLLAAVSVPLRPVMVQTLGSGSTCPTQRLLPSVRRRKCDLLLYFSDRALPLPALNDGPCVGNAW